MIVYKNYFYPTKATLERAQIVTLLHPILIMVYNRYISKPTRATQVKSKTYHILSSCNSITVLNQANIGKQINNTAVTRVKPCIG